MNEIKGKVEIKEFGNVTYLSDLKKLDKIDDLRKKLKEVVDAYNNFKDNGVHKDILISYLRYRTKMPVHKIKQMIEATDEFYKKLIKEDIAEKL